MPDPGDPAGLLDAGWQCEKAGALDKALEHYRLAASETPDPAIVSEALRRQSSVFRLQGRWGEALEAAKHGVAVARGASLPQQLADALNAEAAVHQAKGPLQAAVPIYEQALAASPNDRTRGVVLQNLGAVAAQTGDLASAERRFWDSVLCFRRAGYREGEAIALTNLVAVALDREEFELAGELAREAVVLAKEVNDLTLVAVATKNCAEALAGQHRYADAEQKASEALGYFALAGSTWRQVECYRFLGDVNATQGELAAAASCYERGLDLAREIDATAEVAKLSDRLAALPPRA